MNRLLSVVVFSISASLCPPPSAGEELILTLDQALALARERAPTILAAKARIPEAQGRLTGATLFLQNNPVIETAAGRRRSTEVGHVDAADVEVGISQAFELGGRRSARVAGAEAGVAREVASSDDTARLLLRDVSMAFARTLHAKERQHLTARVEKIMADTLQATEQRYQTGDVSVLDVNVSRSAYARTRSDALSAEASYEAILGDLRTLLGISPESSLATLGDLRTRRHHLLSDLLGHAMDRPDLRVLTAGIQEAQAEIRLGESFTWPDVSFGFRYHREQATEHIVLGTITFTLPVFARGQELRATGAARAQRLRQELDAGRHIVETEVRTAFVAYRRRSEAVEELERNALPVLDDNAALARRSYEVGRMSLAEFLVIQREALDTRLVYLDRLLEVALAGIELEARAGVLQ